MNRNHPQITQAIERNGLYVQAVFGWIPGDATFAYTVGNHERGLPELIVFGETADVAHQMLRHVTEMTRRGDVAASPGTTIPGLEDHRGPTTVRLGAVASPWARAHGLAAFGHYGPCEPDAIPFLQIVTADRDGRFPDDPGFDRHVFQHQPDLSREQEPWCDPFVAPHLLDDPEPLEALARVPILTSGRETGRTEAVAASWVGDGELVVTEPPIFADWVTVGTVIRVDAEASVSAPAAVRTASPVATDLPPMHRYVRVEKESHRFPGTWVFPPLHEHLPRGEMLQGPPREERLLRLIGALGEVHDLGDVPVAVTCGSVHLAIPPHRGGKVGAIMRRLERDGIVREHGPYHDPAPPGPIEQCCAPRRRAG